MLGEDKCGGRSCGNGTGAGLAVCSPPGNTRSQREAGTDAPSGPPEGTLTSASWPPELWENRFLLVTAPECDALWQQPQNGLLELHPAQPGAPLPWAASEWAGAGQGDAGRGPWDWGEGGCPRHSQVLRGDSPSGNGP